MTVEGCGIELSEDEDFVNSAVNTVAHRHINQPVRSTDRHLI